MCTRCEKEVPGLETQLEEFRIVSRRRMDTFQELSVDQWPLLQEKLKALWPLNAGGYYALEINIKNPRLREAFQFKVYCPYGDMENGFIATTVKSENELIIFSIDEDTNKLEEALLKTKVIDWNSKVLIDMASSVVIRLMKKLKTKLELGIFDVWGAKMFFRDKYTKPFDDVKCPPDTYLAAVDQNHIKQVDDTWPYKHSSSQLYFSTLVSNGLSYGLYSQDKKLLAWLFLNEYNFLCHLYCEASHRRKGYGEFLLKTVVNDSLRQGNDVYGYVVPGNEKALEIFSKLEFEWVDDGAWLNLMNEVSRLVNISQLCSSHEGPYISWAYSSYPVATHICNVCGKGRGIYEKLAATRGSYHACNFVLTKLQAW